MSSSKSEIKKEIILNHYENPSHKVNRIKASPQMCSYSQKSVGCIDNFKSYLVIKKNRIVDAKFSGIGCAISTAAADITCSLLINKTIIIGKKILKNYLSMIDGSKYCKSIIGNLYVFDGINKQINRIKCAKIVPESMLKILSDK
jgi:nitrogen fixation NifU-like protein